MTFSPQYLLIFNKNNFNCGILSRSDIVGFCPVGFCLWGFCPVGFCPVGFCLDTILLNLSFIGPGVTEPNLDILYMLYTYRKLQMIQGFLISLMELVHYTEYVSIIGE